MNKIEKIIKNLNLAKHPEGGYYKRNYEASDWIVAPERFAEPRDRPVSTAIYYLLGAKDFSMWHRIKSDELWHHYEGLPLKLSIFDQETGVVSEAILGKVSDGFVPQIVIHQGLWFSARPLVPTGPDSEYSEDYVLCGCTVSPGFDFKDFELADSLFECGDR